MAVTKLVQYEKLFIARNNTSFIKIDTSVIHIFKNYITFCKREVKFKRWDSKYLADDKIIYLWRILKK